MSRTYRKVLVRSRLEDRRLKKVNDGERGRCKCSYCISGKLHKHKKRMLNKE